jgi:endonuclease-3 related protein
MRLSLEDIYQKLYRRFGPQYWWPAESALEVMVGAVLTQNTNWANVEKAIANLKKNKLLSAARLYRLPRKKLAKLIRSAGYYNLKAERLRNFLSFFIKEYKGSVPRLAAADTGLLRRQLLGLKGIGEETADSILLYALDKPVFVVDAYTRRILSRHGLISAASDYARIQSLFTRRLKPQVNIFNEYHALLVRLGKEYCLKNDPKCETCPLRDGK